MGRLLAWLCLLAALSPLRLAASDGAPQSAPSASAHADNAIRATTRLVQIDVIVKDKQGAVLGLTRNDFSILDNGRPQQIKQFSVDTQSEPNTQNSRTQQLPTDTFSNLPQYGAIAPSSVTIVLLDNLNTLAGSAPTAYEDTPYWVEDLALQNAKVHLIEYVKQLKPQDRIAVYGLSTNLRVLSDFTNDREQLLQILNNYDTSSRTIRADVEPAPVHTPVPGPEFNNAINADRLSLASGLNQDRAKTTMMALQAIAGHVANIPGRKNLIWLTADLPLSGQAMARVLSPANIVVYPVDARGLLNRSDVADATSVDIQHLWMHHDAMPGETDEPFGIPAMRELAEQTGGTAFVNTNDITGAVRQAVEDANVTYTLGFYIDANSADGRFHQLKVSVNRPGLSLRYPLSYFAYRDQPASKDTDRNSMITALRSPIESSAIPLTATVAHVAQSAGKALEIQGCIDVRKVALRQQGGLRDGALDVGVFQQDPTGKLLGNSSHRLHLRFTSAGYSSVMKTGVQFRETVPLRPGVSTVRLVIEDPVTAGLGSLIIPLSEIK